MAPYQQRSSKNNNLSRKSFYSSTILSNSTSNFNSSVLYPQSLYADTFDRPQTAESLPLRPTTTGRARHKNMREMIGTTTEDEFEALPIAVRRKYFSTLERLRFAQNSSSFAFNDLAVPVHRKRSIADRRGLRSHSIDSSRHNSITGRRLRKSNQPAPISAADASWFLTLPDKIRKKEFTKEEQDLLTIRKSECVILDAADEAIYKASRRASHKLPPLDKSPARRSMESVRSIEPSKPSRPTSITREMFETFRWMDEEDDLDLRLVLDDYHANLDGVVLPTPTSNQRPSFRRNMSITKIPFGRTSISSLNQTSPTKTIGSSHVRQKSRAMSLITPKHTARDSTSSIDPQATHYQDPEARLKLRVYLASPQKFDEAIEFGFPSINSVSTSVADKENRPPTKPSRDGTGRKLNVTDHTATFFNDDSFSLFSDDASMIEPDSPITPREHDGIFKTSDPVQANTSAKMSRTSTDYSHLGIKKPMLHKQVEGYSQSAAGSREMTLRMTLTRPDLRADETSIYGWQGTRAKSPLADDPLLLEAMPAEKYEIKGPLGGVDGWGPAEKDSGVVKRFWNRVRSSQRKAT